MATYVVVHRLEDLTGRKTIEWREGRGGAGEVGPDAVPEFTGLEMHAEEVRPGMIAAKPCRFPIEAGSIGEAWDRFDEAAKAAHERMHQEFLSEQARSRLVLPGQKMRTGRG